MRLDVYQSMEVNSVHPRVPKELTDVVAKPCSNMFEKPQLSSEVPGD